MTFTNDNISQVFSHYIENFVKINEDEHEEYYKWQVCHEFKNLMDKALKTEDYKFSKALMKVKECTINIINSYIQPFYGLVKFTEKEPSTVKQMFRNLYVYDAENLNVQMKKIADFFEKATPWWENIFLVAIFTGKIHIQFLRICFCMILTIIICIKPQNVKRWQTVSGFMIRGEVVIILNGIYFTACVINW